MNKHPEIRRRIRLSPPVFPGLAFALTMALVGKYADANMNADIVSRFYSDCFTSAGNLAPVYFFGLLRVWLTFALPTGLAAMVFARGSRSVLTQTLACAIGVLLAASIPLDHIEIHNRFARGWILALAAVTLGFLPAILAFLLVPNIGAQRKVRFILYLLLAGLLVGIIAQQGGYS